jgi:hypothetical protein
LTIVPKEPGRRCEKQFGERSSHVQEEDGRRRQSGFEVMTMSCESNGVRKKKKGHSKSFKNRKGIGR